MPQVRNPGDLLKLLGRHVLVIGLLVLLGAVISLGYGLLAAGTMPYEGQAVLLLKQPPRISLTDNGVTAGSLSDQLPDPNRQLRDMATLMTSLDIADKVKERAAADSRPEVQALAGHETVDLRNAVSVSSRDDTFFVKAAAPTAAAATWLATAWAEESTAKVNRLYATSSISDVSGALTQARADLDAAEKDYQQYLASSPINGLAQALTQTEQFLQVAASTNVTMQLALYNAERQSAQNRLTGDYAYVYNLDQQSSAIQALRGQIAQSQETADALYNNQVALLSLLNKLLTSSPPPATAADAPGGSGSQLQLQFNQADVSGATRSKAGQLNEVDALVAAVQKLQGDIHTQIADLQGTLSAPLPTMVPGILDALPAAIQAQIARQNQLSSQLEVEQFKLNQLQHTRDLRQNTYELLRNRVAEQQVNQQISAAVDIVAPANYLDTVRSRSLTRVVLLDGAIGTLVGLLLGLVLAYLLSAARPNLDSNAALRRRLRRGREGTAPAGTRG